MKKIIKIFSFIIFAIVLMNFSFIIVRAESDPINEKIRFENNYTYNEFLNLLSEDSQINVIITFKDIESTKEFVLPYEFENIFRGTFAPYITFNISGKNDFLAQYIYIDNINGYEQIKFIDIFELKFDRYLDESVNSNTLEQIEPYSWEKIEQDIGLDFYDVKTFDNLKIGIIESGIVDESLECFRNITLYTEPLENQNLKVSDHANAICYLINKVSDKILHKDIYSAQINYDGTFTQTIMHALEWYKRKDVKIINVSWGMDSLSDVYTKIDNIFDYYASNHNMIFIKSGGNETKEMVSLPGNSKNIITVGALNSDKSIMTESNYSATYMKPLIVAPGSKIEESGFLDLLANIDDENKNSGSSFSSAITTGIVALLNAEFPNYFNNIETIITTLSAGATKLRDVDLSFELKSGFGLINYHNTREIINNNMSQYYNIEDYTTSINKIINIKPYSSIDIIIGTSASVLDDVPTDDIKINELVEEATSEIYVPRFKLIISKDNELVYEKENINIVQNDQILENILYTKIENMGDNDCDYQLQIIILDDKTIPVSIAIREYNNYIPFENDYYHGWKTEEDKDIIQHELTVTDEEYYCETCDYIKVKESNIIVDPGADWDCGSEVTLNNGDFNDNTITQGFTRILYLGVNTPSKSRLDYNWESSNNSVAQVSIYGTITALEVYEPTYVTISATYKTSVGTSNEIVYYKEFLIVPDTSEEFKVYDYEVQMDSDEAYLFKLVEDNAPTVIFANYYWRIPCQKDESAGVKISQWGTITALAPGEMFIEGWCKYNPYIVISIRVIVT